jgi:hypothetical protein
MSSGQARNSSAIDSTPSSTQFTEKTKEFRGFHTFNRSCDSSSRAGCGGLFVRFPEVMLDQLLQIPGGCAFCLDIHSCPIRSTKGVRSSPKKNG